MNKKLLAKIHILLNKKGLKKEIFKDLYKISHFHELPDSILACIVYTLEENEDPKVLEAFVQAFNKGI